LSSIVLPQGFFSIWDYKVYLNKVFEFTAETVTLCLCKGFVNSLSGGPPTFTAEYRPAEYDQAQSPHDGPPDLLIVPIVPRGGHPTFMAPATTSEFVTCACPRASWSAFSHDGEVLPGERDVSSAWSHRHA
jgi:hypothetical protein